MKNFILITNEEKDTDLKLSKQMIEHIEEKGGRAKVFTDFQISDIPADTECILVLGGDGTLIRVATKVESLEIPLIGVNLGTLGYLCELEDATVMGALDRLMQDDYMMEKRIMLTGHKENCTNSKVALNDIVIHRAGTLQILSLNVYVNGEFLNTYNADGIIVATPTGSTGYSMSAGGPIVDPKGQMLLLTPNNAHNLNAKSIVLSAEDEIEIEIGSRRMQKDEKAWVSFDGDTVEELSVGERFIISKAINHTKICKLNKKSFLEILRKKMEKYT
ncbi:MAG: NAD(+)/NADH kinase [Agathobacter sp.]|nr:NAD(+)/NADH kinase [Agathobacter sp.]